MGLFSRRPTTSSTASATGAVDRDAPDGSDRDVSSPGLALDHPRQIAWRLLDDCGLTHCFSGPGSPQEVFAALTAIAPVLRRSELHGPFIGSIPDRRDLMWTAYAGPARSVVAISCFPEADSRWLLDAGIGGFKPAPAPYRWGFGTLHAHVPAAVADTIEQGELVDLRPLLGLPVPEAAVAVRATSQMSAGMERRVLAAGWESGGSETFRRILPGVGDRTQVVLLVATQGDGWCVCSPIDDAPDGVLPPRLQGVSFRYDLDVFASLAVLRAPLTGDPDEPDDRTILKQACALAQYADRVELERDGTDRF